MLFIFFFLCGFRFVKVDEDDELVDVLEEADVEFDDDEVGDESELKEFPFSFDDSEFELSFSLEGSLSFSVFYSSPSQLCLRL